jgi:hypothetical protein
MKKRASRKKKSLYRVSIMKQGVSYFDTYLATSKKDVIKQATKKGGKLDYISKINA